MRRGVLVWTALLAAPIPASAQAGEAVAGMRQFFANLPQGAFDLSDVEIVTGSAGGTTVFANTLLAGAKTQLLFSLAAAGGGRGFTLALRPDRWSLAESFPQLANPALEGLTLSNVMLVVTDQDISRDASELSEDEAGFYQDIFGRPDFKLVLKPGLNLLAGIPTEGLAPNHPLKAITGALGIETGTIFLQGTLGKSLALLTSPGAGGAAAIKDLYLRAELPPMRPPGSPDWFRHGQLALEITGDPAVRLVGEMTVRIQQDELLFALAAALARSGVSLSGGLRSEQGWLQPFGLNWLTLNRVTLKLGITPLGVQLGFGGDMVIGSKDMDVAVGVTVSPAGVPTNFIFAGESEAGFGMSDLVQLQARMAAARGGNGQSGAVIPLDALPAIEFRKVGLKFAPMPDPDLGVERGMAIKGRLWLPTGQDGTLTDFAGIDASVGEEGVTIKGNLGAFQLGPLSWQDARLDLAATREAQRLRVSGDATLGSFRQKIDVDFTKTALRFNTVTELFGLFHAQLDAEGALDLRRPAFRVHALAENDLAEALGPIVRTAAIRYAAGGKGVLDAADAALRGVRQTLAAAEATADQLRNRLEAQRQAALTAATTAAQTRDQLATQAAATRTVRDRAYRAWDDTPATQPVLKGTRYSAYLAEAARYKTQAARYAAQAAVADAARRIAAAIPPVDRNALVLGADAAAAAIRDQLRTAESNLTALRERFQLVMDALNRGENLVTIERAEVKADLEALLQGEALAWSLSGSFIGRPFNLQSTISFADPASAAGALLADLVSQ
ncbi:MAG TPA: hypothetical protein VIP80_13735 [Gemmatimonadales bacterium]|jgi:hypothetical protein